jgi:eukaryotic-like serine/threonine-protein kinase
VDDSGSALIDGTVFETGDDDSPSERPASLERGATLSRYLLVERVGVGGMGIVWAAYDPELDRKIAIKLLRPRKDRGHSDLARTRLIREAQVMARISHPNVIAVHDVGQYDGKVFLAMEFVQGKTLGRWVKATRRDWREIVAVFVQAGRGLAEAHRAGLVHRDFKPANVLIDVDGRARVLDFGLARSVEGPRTDRDDEGDGEPSSWSASRVQKLAGDPIVTPLTRTGSMLGTPAYMAPEQFERRQFDARADQFAFCIALWEALHHRRPFSGSTIDELSRAVCSGKIDAPPADSRIPGFVDRALRRGLAVDPVERWTSMDELLAELSRDPAIGRRRWLITGAVVASFSAALVVSPMLDQTSASAPSEVAASVACPDVQAQLQAIWTPTRRHELSLAALGSGALAPDRWTGVAAALDRYASELASMRVAVCEAGNTGGFASPSASERCLDDRARAFTRTVELLGGKSLRSGGGEGQVDPQLIAGAHGLLAALPSIDACARPRQLDAFAAAPRDPELAGRVHALETRMLAARVRAELGAVEHAASELRELTKEAELLGDPALDLELRIELATVDQLAGNPERAREQLERAVAEAIRGGHDVIAAEAATRLIDVVGLDLGELAAGLSWAARAEAWTERVDAPAITRAERLVAEAELRRSLGEHETARRQHLAVLELLGIIEDADATPPTDIAAGRVAARALHGLARIAVAEVDFVRARERLTRVVGLRRAVSGEDREQAAAIELALVEVELGNWDVATKAFADGWPDATSQTAKRAAALARLEFASFQLRRAELVPTTLDRAEGLVIAETDAIALLVTDGPEADRATLELARLARLRGQFKVAARMLDSIEQAESLRLAVALERGELALARSKPADALVEFERAAEALGKLRGPSYAEAKAGQGRALALLGRTSEGRIALEQALAIWDELAPSGHPRSLVTLGALASLAGAESEYRSRAKAIRASLP